MRYSAARRRSPAPNEAQNGWTKVSSRSSRPRIASGATSAWAIISWNRSSYRTTMATSLVKDRMTGTDYG